MTTRRDLLASLLAPQGVVREKPPPKPYVVLISAETEYRSETTLSQLAQELESRHAMRCTVLVASSPTDLPGLESLEDAHLSVLFVRSEKSLSLIRPIFSGKPFLALRSSIQAFSAHSEFGEQALGAACRYEHGRDSSTDVSVIPEVAGHPILQGVPRQFHCRSWLYHVLPLASSARPLLMGTPVGESAQPERVPNPVGWAKTYKGGRVFYTSLGHPEDFQVDAFRRLLVNAVYWALDRSR